MSQFKADDFLIMNKKTPVLDTFQALLHNTLTFLWALSSFCAHLLLVCGATSTGEKKKLLTILCVITLEYYLLRRDRRFIFSKRNFSFFVFKGTGSRNRKQTRYLYNLYCCPHVAIMFWTDFGGWGEFTIKLLLKIHQYLCNCTTYECFVCFSTKLKSLFSK